MARKPYFGERMKTGPRKPYFGERDVRTERRVYHGGHPSDRHDHDGFWGALGHTVGQTVRDVETAAIHSPAGVYNLGKAVALDTAEELHGRRNKGRTRRLLGEMGHQTAEDIRHPLRHPGYTALDALAVASLGAGTAARIAAASRIAAEGGGAARVAGALARAPRPGPRVFEHEGATAEGIYSRSALTRSAQRLLDQARRAHPEARIGLRNLPERIGFENARVMRRMEAATRSEAAALMRRAKRFSTAQQLAVRIVAEGKPVEERIRFHAQQLRNLSGRERKAHIAQIRLLRLAERYIDESGGVPHIKPDEFGLIDLYQRTKRLADKRDDILRSLDYREETLRGRITAPGRVIEGTHGRAPQVGDQLTFETELVPEAFGGGEFRVPYQKAGAAKKLARHGQFRGGIPQTPGTFTHTFEGKLLERGKFRNDAAQLVAESYIEAHRYAALLHARDRLIAQAHDVSLSRHDIPIRLDVLRNRVTPQAVKDIVAAQKTPGPELRLTSDEMDALGRTYEGVRASLFPNKQQILNAAEPVAGIKWIDSRVLGGLDKPNPMIGLGQTARHAIHGWDSITNAMRLAILYLKPAYAIPNLLGNAALNLIQQGFAAPANLARAVRLSHQLSPEAVGKLDALMGEGIAAAIRAESGAGQRLTNYLAGKWNVVVDLGFRRSSFIFEARRAGYRDWRSIERLLTDSKHEAELQRIAEHANREIIDYSRLGPHEREIIRRIVFFYPWVKGSTVYAARFVGEHPIKAAATGALGQEGQAINERELGPVPSYAEGIFRTGPLGFLGQHGADTYVSNPAAFSILQTPAAALETAREAALGHVRPGYQLANFLTPPGTGVLAALSHRDPFTGHNIPPSVAPLSIFAEQVYGGLPQLTLAQRIRMTRAERAGRLYPMTARDAILQFLVGGLAPRPVNRDILNARAQAELAGR